VRRPALLALGLLVLGLTTAVASSFSTTTEDLTTFSTAVSISVPVHELPDRLYIRGSEEDAIGGIDLLPPTDNDSVSSRSILLRDETVQAQSDPAAFLVWHSPPAPSSGYLLRGTATLYISQQNDPDDRFTAALLSCPATQPPASTGCSTIAVATAEPETRGGVRERQARFGALDVIIPGGHELRLKIVDRRLDDAGALLSDDDIELQWGYLPARQSRLEIL
jgi:hypothetical protein